MREIILYGPMRSKFGRSFNLDVKSPAEAIGALMVVVPGFKRWFRDRANAGALYHVFIGKRNIATEEVPLESASDEPIRIAPTIRGSKNNKLFGALLAIAGVALFFFGANGGYLVKIGIGLMIAGASLMLVPTPKAPGVSESSKEKASQVFDGPINSADPGASKPILYGTMEVGSVIVSASIRTEDIGPVWAGAGNTPVPPGGGSIHDRWNP